MALRTLSYSKIGLYEEERNQWGLTYHVIKLYGLLLACLQFTAEKKLFYMQRHGNIWSCCSKGRGMDTITMSCLGLKSLRYARHTYNMVWFINSFLQFFLSLFYYGDHYAFKPFSQISITYTLNETLWTSKGLEFPDSRFRDLDFIGQNPDSQSETLQSEMTIPIPRPILSPEPGVSEFWVRFSFFPSKSHKYWHFLPLSQGYLGTSIPIPIPRLNTEMSRPIPSLQLRVSAFRGRDERLGKFCKGSLSALATRHEQYDWVGYWDILRSLSA